jgi:peptidoglycan hydrolase-like protein with peptidoglycan-binding domain
MSQILMFDDVDVDLLPAGYDAYAGYADGIYANISAIKKRFPSPNVHILTVAVKSTDVADALDVENGDASIVQAPSWFKLALKGGVTRPALYTSVSNATALVQEMAAAGIPRTAFRLWTAHYGAGQHICGPSTCSGTTESADATQYTSTANGENLDESACDPDFFTIVVPSSPTAESTVSSGDTGTVVHDLQVRLNVWDANPKVAEDSTFGPGTLTAVKVFQSTHKLTVDGVVGPATWSVLLRTPPKITFAAPTGLRADVGIISVSWDVVPDSLGKAPEGYTVSVSQDGNVVKTEKVAGTTAVIDGLTRNLVYEVSVEADGGQAAPGSAKIAVTA